MKPLTWISASFAVSMVASIGLVLYYFLGDSAQVEGVLLGLALGGMGAGIVGWATSMMNSPRKSVV